MKSVMPRTSQVKPEPVSKIPATRCLACRILLSEEQIPKDTDRESAATAGFIIGYALGVCSDTDVRDELCTFHLKGFNSEARRYGLEVI